MPLVAEVTHHMALVPLLWLGALAFYGQCRSALWWTVALALAISWLADSAAHWVDPWLVSRTYPLVQALVVGLVLLPTPRLWRLLVILVGAWMISATAAGPDTLTHTVAWATIILMAWPPVDWSRRTLALTFASMWVGWIGYTVAPGWASWGIFQGLRAAGLGLFCWASAPQRVRA